MIVLIEICREVLNKYKNESLLNVETIENITNEINLKLEEELGFREKKRPFLELDKEETDEKI
jgi:hypothetical protein